MMEFGDFSYLYICLYVVTADSPCFLVIHVYLKKVVFCVDYSSQRELQDYQKLHEGEL